MIVLSNEFDYQEACQLMSSCIDEIKDNNLDKIFPENDMTKAIFQGEETSEGFILSLTRMNDRANLQKKYGTVIFCFVVLEISREAISVKKDLPN